MIQEPVRIGVELAQFGGGVSVLAFRQGALLNVRPPIRFPPRTDLRTIANRIEEEVERENGLHIPLATVHIETVGLGGALADLLRERGIEVTEVTVPHCAALAVTYLPGDTR